MADSLKVAVAANTAARRALFQQGLDRIVAARVELASALAEFNEAADAENGADAELDAWVAANRDPLTPTPAPIAPEVAAPPPPVEPPVFTSVDTADLTPDTTTPGFAPVVADELNVIETPAEGEGTGTSGGADEPTGK